jgi:hypothetical protein
MAPSEKIQADQPVEDFVESHPALVGFLVHQGLPCIVCGEPFWGTLADLARSRAGLSHGLMRWFGNSTKIIRRNHSNFRLLP